MSEIVEKLRNSSISSLKLMLQEVLEENEQVMAISNNREAILEDFVANMNRAFDKLLGTWVKEAPVVDFESLSLVQDDELNAMVAVEGMVANSRNIHLPFFISFNTRLNAMFPNTRIDESSNPLDPQQIANAFTEATKHLRLDSYDSMDLYRSFNNLVLKRVDQILKEANQFLVENGVIPDLAMESTRSKGSGRSRNRSSSNANFGIIEEEELTEPEEQPELFSMMQNLMHPESTEAPSPAATRDELPGEQPEQVPIILLPTGVKKGSLLDSAKPQPGRRFLLIDQDQLEKMLNRIQQALDARSAGATNIPATLAEVERMDISKTVENILGSEDSGVITTIDPQSTDVINLVTLLYDAIWQDESVPVPIKELIGRTQITIIKLALSDIAFFNNDKHPARMLLNEFAEAGIGWTEVANLSEDQLYKKIEESVTGIQNNYDGDVSFFENLIQDFRTFRAKEAASTRKLEQRILKANERQERLDDINELVAQKIRERILGRDLEPFVTELLEQHFHKFMVMLVLKEGPGSNAWKQSINTIDVLLWSVQSHEQSGDRKRLGTVNPRLLNNIRKALRIAQVDVSAIDGVISRLKEIQEASFEQSGETLPAGAGTGKARASSGADVTTAATAPDASADEDLDPDDPALRQVDSLSVGIWVEFAVDAEQAVRCKLAARINAIDKFIFVNQQGVKVVEKTRMGLAKELRDNTVHIISEGALFSRALESVIGNLRETQNEQRTGNAYQPEIS